MRKINALRRKIKNVKLDLKAIEDEHNHYQFATYEEADVWFNSLPIENLKQSLDKQHNKPTDKFSMAKMLHNFNLRRAYDQYSKELDLLESELRVAEIDYLLERIKKI